MLVALMAFTMKSIWLPLILIFFTLSAQGQDFDYNQPQDEGHLLLHYWEAKISAEIQKNKTAWFKSTYLELVVPEDMHKYNGLMGQMLAVLINISPHAAHLITNYFGSDLLFVSAAKYEEALVRLKYVEKKFLLKRNTREGFCSVASDSYNSALVDDLNHRILASSAAILGEKNAMPSVCKFEGAISFRNCRLDYIYKGENRGGFVYQIDGKNENYYNSKQDAYDAMTSNLSCTGLR